MAPTRNNSASAPNPANKDDGSNHLVECTGPGRDRNGCIIQTNVWVPTPIPKNFFARLFLCGFCAVEELQKMKTSTMDDRSPIIEADSIEQYGRRENVRIFGVEEEPDEDSLPRWLVWLKKLESQSLPMMLVAVTVYRAEVRAQNL